MQSEGRERNISQERNLGGVILGHTGGVNWNDVSCPDGYELDNVTGSFCFVKCSPGYVNSYFMCSNACNQIGLEWSPTLQSNSSTDIVDYGSSAFVVWTSNSDIYKGNVYLYQNNYFVALVDQTAPSKSPSSSPINTLEFNFFTNNLNLTGKTISYDSNSGLTAGLPVPYAGQVLTVVYKASQPFQTKSFITATLTKNSKTLNVFTGTVDISDSDGSDNKFMAINVRTVTTPALPYEDGAIWTFSGFYMPPGTPTLNKWDYRNGNMTRNFLFHQKADWIEDGFKCRKRL